VFFQPHVPKPSDANACSRTVTAPKEREEADSTVGITEILRANDQFAGFVGLGHGEVVTEILQFGLEIA
jgi:hypothetical protein